MLLDELPWRAAGLPAVFKPSDDVAVRITKHCGQSVILDPLTVKKRTARFGLNHHLAPKADSFQRRLHFCFEVALELGGALGILTFRRNRNPTCKVGIESAALQIVYRAGDGRISAHVTILVRPRCQWQSTRRYPSDVSICVRAS